MPLLALRGKTHWIIGLLIFLSLAVLMYRIPLFRIDSHFVMVNRDLEVPIYLDNLIGAYYPMWSDKLSANNFINSFQIDVIVFLVLARIFGLPPITAVSVMMVAGSALSGFFAYAVTFHVVSRTRHHPKYAILASLFAGIFFMVNPLWAYDPLHFGKKIAAAFTPVMILLFWRGFSEKRITYILGGSIVFVLYSAAPRDMISGAVLTLFLCLYSFGADLVHNRPNWRGAIKSFLTHVRLLLTAALSYSLITIYRLLPLAVRIISAGFPQPYLITLESALQPQRSATLFNVLRFSPSPPSMTYVTAPPLMQSAQMQQLFFWLGFVVFFAALGVAFTNPLNRDSGMLLGGFLLWTILSTGLNPFGFPFIDDLFKWLIFRAPLHQYYFWAFRVPWSFWVLATAFGSILLGLFCMTILWKLFRSEMRSWKLAPRRVLGSACLILILLSILLPQFPMFTGSFGGLLQPVKVPDEYFAINEWLSQQPGDFKVLWLPFYGAGKPIVTWGNVPWLQNQTDPQLSRIGIKNFEVLSSSRGTYSIWWSEQKGTPVESYLENLLSRNYAYTFDVAQSNRTESFGKLLGHLNIQYVILNTAYRGTQNLQSFLDRQVDLKLVRDLGIFLIYENKNCAPHVYLNPRTFIVEGGRETLTALSNIQSYDPTNTSLLFLDQRVSWDKTIFDLSDTIILHDWRNLLPIVDQSDVLSLMRYSVHEADTKALHSYWSIAAADNPRYGLWQKVLGEEGIANWDFDYGLGYVATDRVGAGLTVPIDIGSGSEFIVYLRYVPNKAGGRFRVLLDGTELSTIVSKSDQTTRQTIADLGSKYLQSGRHTFTFENISGFNAINYLMLIPSEKLSLYKSQILNILRDKQLVYLELPGLDLSYTNASVTKRYGAETINGLALQYKEHGAAWTWLEAGKAGKYVIGIGTPIQEPGRLLVQIANYSLSVNLGSGRFAYTPPIYLEPNRYVLTVSQDIGHPLVDALLLYTVRNETIPVERLLAKGFEGSSQSKILKFRKVDATKYVVDVDAKAPFWLFLAESYDPNWVAYVNGQSWNYVSSVISYQSINGFPIKMTGRLQITIEFILQRWFYYGSGIAIATLGAVAVIVVRDHRRGKSRAVGTQFNASRGAVAQI